MKKALKRSGIILLLAAAVLLTIVRASYLYFLILGVALMALPHWRRDWLMAIGTIAVLVLLLIAGKHLELFSVERHSEVIGGGWNMNRFYINSDSQQPYKSLLGYYFLYSPLHRLVMLPIPLAAQFLSPLPWTNPVGISYFTLIKSLFSSSLISAIRLVSFAYLRLLIFLLAILIPACDSFSPAFCMMYSA